MERTRGRGGRPAGLRSGLAATVAACLITACGGPSVTVASTSLAAAVNDPSSGVEVFADPEVADAVVAGSVGVDGADDDETAVAEALWRTLVEAAEPWPVVDAIARAADERGEVDATYRDAIAAGLGARAPEFDDRIENDEDERWSDLADLVTDLYLGEGAGVAFADGAIETLLVRISDAVIGDYFGEDHHGAGTEFAFSSESYAPWVDLLQFARFEAEIDRADARRWLAAAANLEPQGQREPIPPARFAELGEVVEGLDDEGPTPSEIATVLEARTAAHLFDAVPDLRQADSPVPDAVGTEDVDAFVAVDDIDQLVTLISRLVATRLDDELGRR